MTKMEFHNQVSTLVSKGILKKDAFVECFTIESPFTTYANYRSWKFRSGIKEPTLLKCEGCSKLVERKSHNQKNCNDCSTSNSISGWANVTERKTKDEPELSTYIKSHIINKRVKEVEQRDQRRKAVKSATKYKDCKYCGDTFHSQHQRAYCSRLCREHAVCDDEIVNRVRNCVSCGDEFYKYYGKEGLRATCSEECNESITSVNRWNQRNKARTTKYGKNYEYINRQDVFDKAKNVCYICGIKCDDGEYNNDVWQPNYITIDHVVSLSRRDAKGMEYGHHTIDNVRTCCHHCNTIKR